jgi:hypothetical protein
MSNVPYLCQRISDILQAFILNAMLIYAPKVVENLFNLSPTKAGLYIGTCVRACEM